MVEPYSFFAFAFCVVVGMLEIHEQNRKLLSSWAPAPTVKGGSFAYMITANIDGALFGIYRDDEFRPIYLRDIRS
jgi:hypothetical protein